MADGIKSLNYPNPQDQLAARLLDLEDRLAQAEKIISGQNLGLRNFIINGDMRINQRTFVTATTGGYNFDRWRNGFFGGTVTASRQAFAPGEVPLAGNQSQNFLRIATSGQSGTDNWSQLWQPIEDARTLAGKTITISFWAKAAVAQDVDVEIAQVFGTGGSSTVFVNAGRARVTTAWQRHSVSAQVPSVLGKTISGDSFLSVALWFSAGSVFAARTTLGIQSGTVDVWGFQVEEGSKPSAFEVRPPQMEIALCQRYYYRFIDPPLRGVWGAANSASRMGMVLPVPMRGTPIVTLGSGNFGLWDGSSGYSGTITLTNNFSIGTHIEIDFTIGSSIMTIGRAAIMYRNTLTGVVELSAEL
jgi:hypothetical protein